jgi:hypothetical protein
MDAGSVCAVTSSRANWARLTQWLVERNAPVVIIAWGELNAIVGGLPDSATKHYPQWWHGDRPNTRAWRRAGYELARVDLGQTVTLRKSAIAWTPSTADHAPPIHLSTRPEFIVRSKTPGASTYRRLIPDQP